ncbi:MAG: hypothetical protein KatS3mg068_2246 [Candidatus Sericytochromatia bacterium]|nr:MAG: hypothetical protein KatS3mg068_2246 [Candidatus Sericytochromatia bacterium]
MTSLVFSKPLDTNKFDLSIKAEKFVEQVNNSNLVALEENNTEVETNDSINIGLKNNTELSSIKSVENSKNIEFLRTNSNINIVKTNIDNMSFKEIVNLFKTIKNINPESEEGKKIRKIS